MLVAPLSGLKAHVQPLGQNGNSLDLSQAQYPIQLPGARSCLGLHGPSRRVCISLRLKRQSKAK